MGLLYDLIRPQQHGPWDRQPERLGGLEIDDQLELRRLLDRQVARLGTPQDPVDVRRRPTLQVGEVAPIGHQTAILRKFPFVEIVSTRFWIASSASCRR